MPLFAAILLIGGSGIRFGGEKPKQFQFLSGKKVYLHAFEALVKSAAFKQLILVCHPAFLQEVQKDLQHYSLENIQLVEGGNTRQESSYRGILQCEPEIEYVMIHDGVRPFVSQKIIKENIQKVLLHQAVDTCTPSFDTIVESGECGRINRIPNRSHYWRGQTPQTFNRKLILQAHQHALDKGLNNVSDDCRLILEDGISAYIVQGDEQNIKITTELDLFIAEQLIRLQSLPLEQSFSQGASIRGKKYLVVGGTGGIGSAICDILRKEGAIPIPLSRNTQPHAVNLLDLIQVEEVLSSILQEHGPLDGLINSAGLLKIKELDSLSSAEIHELLHVNLHTVIFTCKYCMIKPGGHIINIASSAFTRGRKNYSIYSCAKAAVVNFTQALAEELPHLVIHAVVPQRTLTPMRTLNFPGENENSLLHPSEVAQTILELLNSQGSSGHIVEVRKKI